MNWSLLRNQVAQICITTPCRNRISCASQVTRKPETEFLNCPASESIPRLHHPRIRPETSRCRRGMPRESCAPASAGVLVAQNGGVGLIHNWPCPLEVPGIALAVLGEEDLKRLSNCTGHSQVRVKCAASFGHSRSLDSLPRPPPQHAPCEGPRWAARMPRH